MFTLAVLFSHRGYTFVLFSAAKAQQTARMEPLLPKEYEVVQGQNVTLECIGHGSPVPYIVWDKHQGELPLQRKDQIWGEKKFAVSTCSRECFNIAMHSIRTIGIFDLMFTTNSFTFAQETFSSGTCSWWTRAFTCARQTTTSERAPPNR